jgi:diguanylate cyclase (GGDEF)-like protein
MAARAGKAGTGKAVLGIYVACTLVALLIVASLAFVLDRSVSEADRFGLTGERRLIGNELQHQIDAVVQYQAELSFWDKTYNQLERGGFTDAFVAEEIKDWLWKDFGFSWMIFADASDRTLLAVKDGMTVHPSEGESTLKWADDLIDKANGLYEAALMVKDNGWTLRSVVTDRDMLAPTLPNIHASDLRMIDGKMSVVVVQAVVPKSLDIPAARRKPVFMVTVKPFTTKMIADLEHRLDISNFIFAPLRQVPADAIHVPVNDCGQPACMVAAWTPDSPGSFVRAETLPSVIAIAMIGALVMAFIAARFGSVFSALQTSEAENRHLAKHDRLTGLLNRSGFDEKLLASLSKTKERPFALLCLDLDRFKAVNDSHGHPAGDAVLRTLASRFESRVGPRGAVARLGGDEFAVILDQGVSQLDVVALANALIVDAQVPVEFGGQLLCVGASAGAAFAPIHGTTAREIVPSADQALYLAKRRGRNRMQTAFDIDQAEQLAPTEQAA